MKVSRQAEDGQLQWGRVWRHVAMQPSERLGLLWTAIALPDAHPALTAVAGQQPRHVPGTAPSTAIQQGGKPMLAPHKVRCGIVTSVVCFRVECPMP